MKLCESDNEFLIRMLESATELKKNKRYFDADKVNAFVGLAVHNSGFYGLKLDNGDLIPIKDNETILNSSDDLNIFVLGNVCLPDEPVNVGTGSISYSGPGSIQVGSELIYDGKDQAHSTYSAAFIVSPDGNDEKATKNKYDSPFLTINAAADAAVKERDKGGKPIVVVRKGVYNEWGIGRDRVDMNFEYGAIVWSEGNIQPVFHDFNEPLNITVTGYGQFYHKFFNPFQDNQAIALENVGTKFFNFEAYEVDGIQLYRDRDITAKFSNLRVRFNFDHWNNVKAEFTNCKFLTGCAFGIYRGENTSIRFTSCEFTLPSNDFLSVADVNDIDDNLLFSIDVSSVYSPIDTSALTRQDVIDTVETDTFERSQLGAVVYNQNLRNNWFTDFSTFYLELANCIIRVQKENACGVRVIQHGDNAQVDNPGFFIMRSCRITDETTAKSSTGLVVGSRTTVTSPIDFMVEGTVFNTTSGKETTAGTNTSSSYVELLNTYSEI
jgi:hypothetical protein